MEFQEFFHGKRVIVTGHTGFKGAWLTEWLLSLGAEVIGISLDPWTTPSLFEQLGLESRVEHHISDIRDFEKLQAIVAASQPDIVFHLAAQPLVRLSYKEALETYSTNVMGTVHLLEALKSVRRKCAAVFVTSDKCYENREVTHAYREDDPLGGFDPYSSSKACAEIAIDSFRNSFFLRQIRSAVGKTGESEIRIASARAGNVIGGGDWATDRLVPDCMRSLLLGEEIAIRNPQATRPWQHVLEPLSGYMLLAQQLYERPDANDLCSAFNFGPDCDSNRTVAALVQELLKHWPGKWRDASDPGALHEATLLHVATDKAFHHLGWRPVWNFQETIEQTARWYRTVADDSMSMSAEALELTRMQIRQYCEAAQRKGLSWVNASAENLPHRLGG